MAFAHAHPDRVARMADAEEPPALALLLEALPPEDAARVLAACTPQRAALALRALGAEPLLKVNAAVGPQRLAWMLAALPAAESSALRERLPAADQRTVGQLLRYGADVAGGVAEPRMVCAHARSTVEQALKAARAQNAAAHYYVYVVGHDQQLVGVASLRALLLADREAEVGSVMTAQPEFVLDTLPLAAVVAHAGWSRFSALPVATASGQLVGVIGYARHRELVEGLALSFDSSKPGANTASALAELYGVGASALVRWVGSALSGEEARDE